VIQLKNPHLFVAQTQTGTVLKQRLEAREQLTVHHGFGKERRETGRQVALQGFQLGV
jgi:hypothetical protein